MTRTKGTHQDAPTVRPYRRVSRVARPVSPSRALRAATRQVCDLPLTASLFDRANRRKPAGTRPADRSSDARRHPWP
jgi:hypothetical protein